MRPNGSPVFFNPSDETLIEYVDRQGALITQAIGDADVTVVALEDSPPMRSVPSWQGKNVYEGSYWSSTVRKHVCFESLLEREWLISADFDPNAVAFQWQPFALKWPRGTKGHRGHIPDFFCRMRSGDGVVVDVKRPDRVNDIKVAKQFEMTRNVCESVGWRYEVFSGTPDPRRQNLGFLAGFRQGRYSPSPEARAAISDTFEGGASIEFGAARLQKAGANPSVLRGHLWHEIWMGRLQLDLNAPLANDAVLTSTRHGVDSVITA